MIRMSKAEVLIPSITSAFYATEIWQRQWLFSRIFLSSLFDEGHPKSEYIFQTAWLETVDTQKQKFGNSQSAEIKSQNSLGWKRS